MSCNQQQYILLPYQTQPIYTPNDDGSLKAPCKTNIKYQSVPAIIQSDILQNMDDSSFLSTSSKCKKRKPIFPKAEHSPVNKLDEHLRTSASYHHLPHRISDSPLLYSSIRAPSWLIEDSRLPTRVEAPLNAAIRVSFSQPKMAVASHQPIIYHPHPVPNVRSITPQRPVHQQPLNTPHPPPLQSAFYQTMQPSTLRRSSHHLYQTQPVSMVKVQRRSRVESKENSENERGQEVMLRPTVVAIERVMKEVGSNRIETEITYLSKEEGRCDPPQIRVTAPPSPSDFTMHSASHSPVSCTPATLSPPLTPSRILPCSSEVEMSKLSQINSLLTENYNLLYNQFFSLKREIREEEVVQEQAFLQKSANQIESIFNLQTTQALSKIEEVFQSSKQPLKKGFKNRQEIKMRNVYV